MLRAVSGTGPRVLAQAHAAASKSDANTTEAALATVTVPANTLGASGTLRVTAKWTVPNSATVKTVRAKFGGTEFARVAATTTNTVTMMVEISNRGAANSQIGNLSGTDAFLGTSGVNYNTGAIDTTAAQDITLTAQWGTAGAGSNNIVLESYIIEVLP